ncbi:hypothetical protein BU111_12760 [Staphylococcus xylosus]|uniref:Uncharacterized protein n=1 Tax=Staphylococcus xylosus TaxID=1288 RepID=A0AAQ0LXM3_STAXY|nr:hypothetical protein [Staphylococcus xylosus]MCQ3819679.1 hypothetical protein [Staphylococcus xylosus]PKI04541.1 hypothetical protein CW744_10150 [Staphylococcus xylosus]PTI02236.1 hypothetical protein BU105_01550 [Staphylococcus xylosus]PTI48297.1 hypothetical protein BU111_12760 [Staphylococcus xylosus]
MNLTLKILIGIIFVSIMAWNNAIQTRQNVNKKAYKDQTQPMNGKQFRFMLLLNIIIVTLFYLLLMHTYF